MSSQDVNFAWKKLLYSNSVKICFHMETKPNAKKLAYRVDMGV